MKKVQKIVLSTVSFELIYHEGRPIFRFRSSLSFLCLCEQENWEDKKLKQEQEHVPSPVINSPLLQLCFGTSMDFIIFLNCSNSLKNWGCNWSFFVLGLFNTFGSVEGGDRANALKPGKNFKMPSATSGTSLLLRGAFWRKTCVKNHLFGFSIPFICDLLRRRLDLVLDSNLFQEVILDVFAVAWNGERYISQQPNKERKRSV